MNLLALFTKGEKVWVLDGTEIDTITFKELEINEVGVDGLVLIFDESTMITIPKEEVTKRVFKKTWITDMYVNSFNNHAIEKQAENHLSKIQLLQEIQDEMLSLQFCDTCLLNEGVEESMEIDGLTYLGTVFDFFGEVENYKLEGVYELNGEYYVSYDAGNGHCHIGKMDKGMTAELKSKLEVVK